MKLRVTEGGYGHTAPAESDRLQQQILHRMARFEINVSRTPRSISPPVRHCAEE
jgi:hypothetical protein